MRLPSVLLQGLRGILLAAHLVQLITAQSVNPSDRAQSPYPTGDGQLQLAPPSPYPNGGGSQFRVDLVNLTLTAVSKLSAAQGPNENIHQNVAFVAPNSTYRIELFTGSTIAIIPCDSGPGFSTPIQAVEDAVSRGVPAIILYSTTQPYCNFTAGGSISPDYILYSTTDPSTWQAIARGVTQSQNYGQTFGTQWYIGQKTVLDNVTMSGNTSGNGGGQVGNGSTSTSSPSTAVAMIILYSITGVITALFLVIIVTGAVRAHRHPERYGPRNVLGRPRQSRAKGLARAMLETIPIVKFGEEEEHPAKPTDVEMANTATATDKSADGEEADGSNAAAPKLRGGEESTAGASADTDNLPSPDIQTATGTGSGEPAAATKDDDALGCSICTEDFEKGQDVRVLPCNHNFHPACIDPWLLNVSGTCPLCRIDLRPTETTDNDTLSPNAQLPPPLDADATAATDRRNSRRFSGFLHEILNPRRMQEASREERIAALRRFREGEQGQNTTEEVETRRRRRITARLGETFGVRTRARETSPPAESAGASSPTRSGSAVTAATHHTHAADTEAGAVRSIAEASIPEEPSTAPTSTTTPGASGTRS